ncbi:hypothetical protein IE53DRAFT_360142 [Violaceomyces palustris]|uniref:Uncharacterized protein n=1 Tax=Violaceomyces palustris TaxID=1673888 RepID=A0ACD0P5B8_9BASI|nr:hypothetical protein IE53DRAFT_360142 [Violaceomyces palustris]
MQSPFPQPAHPSRVEPEQDVSTRLNHDDTPTISSSSTTSNSASRRPGNHSEKPSPSGSASGRVGLNQTRSPMATNLHATLSPAQNGAAIVKHASCSVNEGDAASQIPCSPTASTSATANQATMLPSSARMVSAASVPSPGMTGTFLGGNGPGGSSTASSGGRMRAHTSSHAAGSPAPNYNQVGRSARSSPQMRAYVPDHQNSVPPLPSLGASVSPPSHHPPVQQAPQPIHALGHLAPNGSAAYERHTAELTSCIIAFLSPILPTEEEYRIKEATRRQLERLAARVSPGAKLLAFGSMANGFALRNSGKKDGEPTTKHTASELVEILGQLIREETDFNVMPLPKARIPIIKISRSPTAELPYEISCDIGFENRLALENTRLLLSYAMVDPPRLRTLVLFLKVWTKRRKLNSPYTGTLSSYGYTLLVLFFLTHVKRPAVLPNLQRIPPTRPLSPEEVELNGHNIYFYDDVATLRKEWSSKNKENVGELLIDFFKYFSKEFSYSKDVISLRTEGGLMSKDTKAWTAELCIEDPFQMGYNVSRTVTKDGLYTIRGEFMRASRILVNRSGRVSAAIAELCEEREEVLARAPDGPIQRPPRYPTNTFVNAGNAALPIEARPFKDFHSVPRRYETSNYSGYGGSFAFEQMARGLGQGVAFPPTTAMLAPLSRTHGLSPKPHPPPRFSTHEVMMSSAHSENGSSSSNYDPYRSGAGHASARTSPSFRHALPMGLHPATTGGAGTQEAFAYGAEISFGNEVSPAGSEPMTNGRTKTSRSLSETLNRSKSLPRPNFVGEHHTAIPHVPAAYSSSPPLASPGATTAYGSLESQMAGMTIDGLGPPLSLSPKQTMIWVSSVILQDRPRSMSLKDPLQYLTPQPP